MAEETLRKKINGKNLYARMAEYDSEGNFIASTYSRKDEPAVDLVAGAGITITDSQNATTVAVSQDLAAVATAMAAKPSSGRYALDSVNGTLTWVEIGVTSV